MPPLIRAMRPRQWAKNVFVFVAILFDRQLIQIDSLLRVAAAFVLLCLLSSAVYLFNDLQDIESDRRHPTKRYRPLPAGQLSTRAAWMAAVLLAGGSLLAGYLVSPSLAAIFLLYIVLQIAYTVWLKHVALIDVLAVASGFVLRIAAGVVVIDVQRFSPWLYVFGGFLALFIALGKRRHELSLLGREAGNHRAILEDYTIELIDKLLGIVTTSAIVAYSLYTFLSEGLPENNFMMLTIPFIMYAIFRYLFLIHIRHEGGTPEDIFLRDRPLQATIAVWGLIVFVALYIL